MKDKWFAKKDKGQKDELGSTCRSNRKPGQSKANKLRSLCSCVTAWAMGNRATALNGKSDLNVSPELVEMDLGVENMASTPQEGKTK